MFKASDFNKDILEFFSSIFRATLVLSFILMPSYTKEKEPEPINFIGLYFLKKI